MDVPADILGINPSLLTKPSGFKIWVYELDTSNFGGHDLIHVDWMNIPLGTFATAFGVTLDGTHAVQTCSDGVSRIGQGPRSERCGQPGHGTIITTTVADYTPYTTPITETALLMPIPRPGCSPTDPSCNPSVPEPISLLLLGTGLLGIGRQWRKRHGRNQSIS